MALTSFMIALNFVYCVKSIWGMPRLPGAELPP